MCAWELVEHKKIKAAECVQGHVVEAVEAAAVGCLARPPEQAPLSAAGYYARFFDEEPIKMSKDELLAPFREAFESDDPE